MSWREKKEAGDFSPAPFATVHFIVHHTGESRGKQREIGSPLKPIFSNAGNHLPTGAKIMPPDRSNS